MESKKSSRQNWSLLVYPLLMAVNPVLFLYARNMEETPTQVVVRAGLICLGSAAVLSVAMAAAIRNAAKTAIAASIVVAMFCSYGQVVLWLWLMLGKLFRVGVVFGPVWVLAMIVLVIAVVRTSKPLGDVMRFVGVLAVLMVALPIAQIAVHRLSSLDVAGKWNRHVTDTTSGKNGLGVRRGQSLPDIYCIVVDAYSRADYLRDKLGFDNTAFIKWLESKGFYVAPRSNSNYVLTLLSVPALLNLDYIQNAARDAGISKQWKELQAAMVRQPKVVTLLRNAGYKVVEVPSRFSGCRMACPDVRLHTRGLVFGDFEATLVASTLLRVVRKTTAVEVIKQRDAVIGVLDFVPEAVRIKGPKLVFVHTLVAHPPFYVRADGSAPPLMSQEAVDALSDKDYNLLYVGAIQYLNNRLKPIIEDILSSSKQPPIIILLGDHGRCGTGDHPGSVSANLEAYYLPDGGRQMLYPTISPVNTFRVVLSRYFGMHYSLLDDATYVTNETHGRMEFVRMRSSRPGAGESR